MRMVDGVLIRILCAVACRQPSGQERIADYSDSRHQSCARAEQRSRSRRRCDRLFLEFLCSCCFDPPPYASFGVLVIVSSYVSSRGRDREDDADERTRMRALQRKASPGLRITIQRFLCQRKAMVRRRAPGAHSRYFLDPCVT